MEDAHLQTLLDLLVCASSHETDVRLVGNVRAGDIVEALTPLVKAPPIEKVWVFTDEEHKRAASMVEMMFETCGHNEYETEEDMLKAIGALAKAKSL